MAERWVERSGATSWESWPPGCVGKRGVGQVGFFSVWGGGRWRRLGWGERERHWGGGEGGRGCWDEWDECEGGARTTTVPFPHRPFQCPLTKLTHSLWPQMPGPTLILGLSCTLIWKSLSSVGLGMGKPRAPVLSPWKPFSMTSWSRFLDELPGGLEPEGGCAGDPLTASCRIALSGLCSFIALR